MRITVIVGILAASFTPVISASSQDSSGLEEIIVTSSRISTPLRQTGTSVSVLDAADIQARGNLSLTEILRSMPSVAVSNSGGAGKTTTLRIRGEEGFRTLVLLDGLKLSDPSITQVQAQLEHTLSNGIERVEVLRGPQGFNYGADAGGIIAISTRADSGGQPGGMQTQFDALHAAQGTRQMAANFSAGNQRADVYVGGTKFQTDGFNILSADTALADDDGYENTSLHTRMGFQATQNLRLDLVHRDVDGTAEFDSCFSSLTFTTVHDCLADYQQRGTRFSADYTAANGQHSIAWSNVQTDRENFSEGVSGFSSRGAIERVEYLGNYSGFSAANLVYGIDSEEEDNNGDTRRQLGYYLEYLSNFSTQFFITAGVRLDDNDEFGRHTSYRLTTAYLIDLPQAGTVKLRANYGTGFRAPSLFESDYNRGPWATPPAAQLALNEELSRGYEAAVEFYGKNNLHAELVYFRQQVRDAIYFDLSTFSGYLQESGRSESEGFELSASLPLSDQWSVQGNYTWNKARTQEGQQRLRRPRDLSNLGLSYRSLDGRLGVHAFHRSSSHAIDQMGNIIVNLDDYAVVDLSASFRLLENVELYARLENVADARYEEVTGYNNAGRMGYLGIRLTL